MDLFPSSGKRGEEDTYSVGPLRKELISITGQLLSNLDNSSSQPFREYLAPSRTQWGSKIKGQRGVRDEEKGDS
jgi:hypothetical protein